MKVDPSAEKDRRVRLAALRKRRDGTAVEAALSRIEHAARGDDNLMPHVLSAVEAHATLGEISDRLRAVFGHHQEAFSF